MNPKLIICLLRPTRVGTSFRLHSACVSLFLVHMIRFKNENKLNEELAQATKTGWASYSYSPSQITSPHYFFICLEYKISKCIQLYTQNIRNLFRYASKQTHAYNTVPRYLEKQDFLNRVDHRQFELEKSQREAERVKRMRGTRW